MTLLVQAKGLLKALKREPDPSWETTGAAKAGLLRAIEATEKRQKECEHEDAFYTCGYCVDGYRDTPSAHLVCETCGGESRILNHPYCPKCGKELTP